MPSKQPQNALFQVYLRLRPPMTQRLDDAERFLTVEPPEASQDDGEIVAPVPTHVTLQPPNDTRKRAIEKFGFTKVFEENATQLDIFHDTGMESIVRGVLKEGRDGLVATLGVTGSGKSHTILGSKSQRGITQMALDVIFRSLEPTKKTEDGSISPLMLASLAASDASEAQLFSAQTFLEAVYGEPNAGRSSRAQTPMSPSRAHTPSTVRSPESLNPQGSPTKRVPVLGPDSPRPDPSRIYGPNGMEQVSYDPLSTEQSRKIDPGSLNLLSFTHPNTHETRLAKSRLYVFKEPTPALIFPRRQPRERPPTTPRLPDVSHLAVDLNSSSDYVVLVSMYEVYNDRIFDLLSPSIVPGQGNTMSRGNAQKDRRRPLLFKPTEGSPDRKLVAGLRKIACSSYEEALAILDVGLTERKVTGTGANSVSSRSHGFFCLEVKKLAHSKRQGEAIWTGNTLTVVDLAGSERARTAKTAGATLAEAGKINESLMYLGQCLQMQSNLQDGVKTALVPYRQCKLTELLFSNSFPSSNQMSRGQYPQKAVMVVTADPVGDFNATSQILRYSALAREVTVPRIPSLTESIISVASARGRSTSGRTSPNDTSAEDLDRAMAEIARLTKDCHGLAVRLAEEEIARSEVELRLQAAEDRCVMIEQEVREECWADMDEQMEEERRRWQAAWDEQIGRNDDHIDKKIELVSRGFNIYEDPEQSTNERVEELENENEQLRRRLAILEREMSSHSPTRKPRAKQALPSPIRTANRLGRESEIENALQRMNQLNLTDSMFSPPSPTPKSSSPGKKTRKISTRKWDLAPESEI
ncbi:kinesin family protein [Penicillium brasilianum]|uniref:Kinesin family protein n=1 Tax=Penicillium brasilianum TaxID=104259 RepID=A0A1S9RBZ0_PENBI|nr:kinesin family protein [Penicillium brasilianum]